MAMTNTKPMNVQAIEIDAKCDEAVEVFLSVGRASTSLLQRRMGMGYTRAAKLCDQMEARGIVGTDRGAKVTRLADFAGRMGQFQSVCAQTTTIPRGGPKGSADKSQSHALFPWCWPSRPVRIL